jgi:hypothetical protein
MRCPSCHAPISSDDVFCGSCGYRITAQDRAAAATQPAPVSPSPGGGANYQPQPFAAYTPPPQQPVVQPSYDQQAVRPAKKKTSGCLIAAIVLGVLVLCGGVIIGGIFVARTVLPSLGTTSGGVTVQPSGAQVPLDVVNNLNVAICYLYISPSTSDSWGEDWLWDIGWIDPGDSATFQIVSGETVDLLAEDCSGNTLDERYNVTVPRDGLTYTLRP